jgi:hypothetical protein
VRRVARVGGRGVLVLLIASAIGCSTRGPIAGSSTEWIGKSMNDVTRTLGRPSQVIPLIETGGKLLIYTRPNEPHYVFELGVDNRVSRVSVTE